MEESLKTRIILILGVLSAILLIICVGSCSGSRRVQNVRDSEMAKRLDAEEKLSKTLQEKNKSDEKLALREKELEEEKAAHQATKKALVQEQLVNQSLKEELQKVSKLKEALEDDLKEALVAGKAAKHKTK
ncbi:MAG: hypothetical protein Q8N85_04140 [Candidatus Omnitrophota bacterium]|nr:hypothetical protein [Candidatus Omnitrophota bacterium]